MSPQAASAPRKLQQARSKRFSQQRRRTAAHTPHDSQRYRSEQLYLYATKKVHSAEGHAWSEALDSTVKDVKRKLRAGARRLTPGSSAFARRNAKPSAIHGGESVNGTTGHPRRSMVDAPRDRAGSIVSGTTVTDSSDVGPQEPCSSTPEKRSWVSKA